MKKFNFFIVFLAMLFVAGGAHAATYYLSPSGSDSSACSQSAPCATLSKAFSVMKSGDTVYLADGTYAGSKNAINYSSKPPSGTSSAYTTVKAVNPGSAVIDGQGSVDLMSPYNSVTMSYVQFDGLQWVNSSSDIGTTGSSDTNRTVHHIKFTRCGFQNMFDVSYSSYILVEDCYVTGEGRYSFIAFTSDHVVFRRCVGRLDNANGGGMPISNFINYTSQYVEFQNCIAIDSNDQYYSNYNYAFGGIYLRMSNTISQTWSSTNTGIKGSIILNVHHSANLANAALTFSGGVTGTKVENLILWDSKVPYVIANGPVSADFTVNHLTAGVGSAGSYNNGFMAGTTSYGRVTNSIFYGGTGITALSNLAASNYNAFYANTTNKSGVTSSTGDVTTTNPLSGGGLAYLPRIETSGSLHGTASDGGNRGATILYQYGVSGTLHGDSGYDTLTTNPLWPWPYEGTIKAFFLKYGTGNGSPANARGFATGYSKDGSPQTLTKYIWEYLGNQIPDSIYADSSGGSTSLVAPTGLHIVQ